MVSARAVVEGVEVGAVVSSRDAVQELVTRAEVARVEVRWVAARAAVGPPEIAVTATVMRVGVRWVAAVRAWVVRVVVAREGDGAVAVGTKAAALTVAAARE